MSWIKVRTNLSDDPSVWEIADALGMDAFAVIGRLHAMWAWFDSQATADDPWVTVSAAAMDKRLSCPGWCAAVQAAKWLIIDEASSSLGLPNFERHNGQSAKDRALAQSRMSKHRSRTTAQYVAEQVTPPLRSRYGPVTPPLRSRYAPVTVERNESVTEPEHAETQNAKSLHSNDLPGYAPVTVPLRSRYAPVTVPLRSSVTPPFQEERRESREEEREKTDAGAHSTLKNTLSNTSGPVLPTPDPELVAQMVSGAAQMRAAINRRNKSSPASDQIPLKEADHG